MSATDGAELQRCASIESASETSSCQAFDDLPFGIRVRALAQVAYEEYRTRGDLQALEACIECERTIVDMPEDDISEKARVITNLATSLHSRFESGGEPRDLEESISLGELADSLTPDESPDKPIQLSYLASSILSRFKRNGRPEDLERTIGLVSRATNLVDENHELKPSLLDELGSSLLTRFTHAGNTADLDEAISLLSRVVALTPNNDPDKPGFLSNLGASFIMRWERLGNIEDIERFIKCHSRSVELVVNGSIQADKPRCLNNAGASWLMQFERFGSIEYLTKAIEFRSQAVELTPDDSPHKPLLLNGLADSLGRRYQQTGNLEDLEQTIAYVTRAVEVAPDNHPIKPGWLGNLGRWLQIRFERSESPNDLDAAITHLTNALRLTPEGRLDKHIHLYNLSRSLLQRFNCLRHSSDLEQAISYCIQSVELLPEAHSGRAQNFRLLGSLFETRSKGYRIRDMLLKKPLSHAQIDDATRAMEAFFKGMQHPTSNPLERLLASHQYAKLVTRFLYPFTTPPPFTALQAWEYALNLIPQCVWLGITIEGRYASKELQVVSAVVNEAATAAIVAGEFSQALEWLEAGRVVVWSQVLQLRTPLDDLQHDHPQLAEDLCRVSQALQSATSSTPTASTGPQSITSSLSAGTNSPHSHVLEYENLLTRIRGLPGFEDFMRPKTLPQLANACAAGPVVMINLHQSRCDALILSHSSNVIHVPLPNFSLVRAKSLQTLLWDFLRHEHLLSRCRGETGDEIELEDRGVKPRRTAKHVPGLIRQLLATLWVEVVKPIMDVVHTLALCIPSTELNGALPHITWCPTGPLAFLPLHAAGIYPKDNIDPTPSETIMDLAVSSYTPTLEALLKPRTKVALNGECPKTLIVSQPNTPGCSPIRGTTEEAAIVMSLLDLSASTPLHDTEGTVDAVLKGMATHHWVHLACHGVQNHYNPLHSAFSLYNGRLTLKTLMTEHLLDADLAVLSACQTATGDEKLSEEAVHLAAGMLNIGYKSVIGTMWSIYDSSAPVVMGRFYEVMAEQVRAGGELQPAYALHEATKALRAKYGVADFVRWIPFIHFGL